MKNNVPVHKSKRTKTKADPLDKWREGDSSSRMDGSTVNVEPGENTQKRLAKESRRE